jgi:hypothetical protein
MSSSSEPVDLHALDARAVRVPNQDRPARVLPLPVEAEPPEGRVVLRELRTDRPVSRSVAAERLPSDGEWSRGDVPWANARERADSELWADEQPSDAAEREVVRRLHDDRTGGDWRVFERDARRIPGSRGPRCLYFDGEGVVRRVWQYPPDWLQLPADDLLGLMDRPPYGER